MPSSEQSEEQACPYHANQMHAADVNGHGDHRVVMALALAGFSATGETIIDTAEAAEVTYPTFADDFRRLGARIEIIKE